MAQETKLKLALISRTKEKLDKASTEFKEIGIEAKGFPTDLSDADQIKTSFGKISKEYGSIVILVYNAIYFNFDRPFEIKPETLDTHLRIAISGLLLSIQGSIHDLSQNNGTILVTGGGLALHPEMSSPSFALISSMKAAQHNLIHGISSDLTAKNIKIYEIIIAGLVKDEDENYRHSPNKIAQVYYDTYKNGIKDDKLFIVY